MSGGLSILFAVALYFALPMASGVGAPRTSGPELPCLTYGVVEVEGRLTHGRGALILRLARPRCARPRAGAEAGEITTEPLDNVRELHVFATAEPQQLRLRAARGKRVVIKGALASAHTRYHMAPLVLNVDTVRVY